MRRLRELLDVEDVVVGRARCSSRRPGRCRRRVHGLRRPRAAGPASRACRRSAGRRACGRWARTATRSVRRRTWRRCARDSVSAGPSSSFAHPGWPGKPASTSSSPTRLKIATPFHWFEPDTADVVPAGLDAHQRQLVLAGLGLLERQHVDVVPVEEGLDAVDAGAEGVDVPRRDAHGGQPRAVLGSGPCAPDLPDPPVPGEVLPRRGGRLGGRRAVGTGRRPALDARRRGRARRSRPARPTGWCCSSPSSPPPGCGSRAPDLRAARRRDARPARTRPRCRCGAPGSPPRSPAPRPTRGSATRSSARRGWCTSTTRRRRPTSPRVQRARRPGVVRRRLPAPAGDRGVAGRAQRRGPGLAGGRSGAAADDAVPPQPGGRRRRRRGPRTTGAGSASATAVFRAVKGCARCVITTIDPDTGVREREPIASLARIRRWDDKTWFGINLMPGHARRDHPRRRRASRCSRPCSRRRADPSA